MTREEEGQGGRPRIGRDAGRGGGRGGGRFRKKEAFFSIYSQPMTEIYYFY